MTYNMTKHVHLRAGGFGVRSPMMDVVVFCGLPSYSLAGSPLTVKLELYLDAELSNVYFLLLAKVPRASSNSC